MIHPDRIGHIVLKVRNLERSRRFYTEILGLDVMKELPEVKMVFLASNRRDHHEIALVEVGEGARAPEPGDVGLPHCAFRLKSAEDLLAAYREFKQHGVPISFTVNHGVTLSIYFLDPDSKQRGTRWEPAAARNSSRACATGVPFTPPASASRM